MQGKMGCGSLAAVVMVTALLFLTGCGVIGMSAMQAGENAFVLSSEGNVLGETSCDIKGDPASGTLESVRVGGNGFEKKTYSGFYAPEEAPMDCVSAEQGNCTVYTVSGEPVIFMGDWGEMELTVYVDESLSIVEAKALGTKINLLENVHRAVFISNEEALEDIPADVLRHRFKVTVTDTDRINEINKQLLAIEGVEEVSKTAVSWYWVIPAESEADAMERYQAFRQMVSAQAEE